MSFSVRHYNAHCGAVLTASHNPYHDNGFKVYFDDGAQVVAPHAESIVDAVNAVDLSATIPFLEKCLEGVNTEERYQIKEDSKEAEMRMNGGDRRRPPSALRTKMNRGFSLCLGNSSKLQKEKD